MRVKRAIGSSSTAAAITFGAGAQWTSVGIAPRCADAESVPGSVSVGEPGRKTKAPTTIS